MKLFINKIPLLLILFLFIVLNLNYLHLPLDLDQGVFSYIGYNWLHNNVIPYRDVFDHKSPLVYLTYGIATLAGPQILFVRIASIIYRLLILIVFYYFIKKTSNAFIAFLITLVAAFYFSSVTLHSVNLLTETLVVLPSLIFAYFTYLYVEKDSIKKYALLAGSFAGIAFLTRPPVLLFFLGILLLLFFKKVKNIQYVFFGFLIPFTIAIIYFAIYNALPDFLEDTFRYNSLYISSGLNNEVIGSIPKFLIWVISAPVIVYPLFIISITSLALTWKRRNTLWYISFIWLITTYISLKLGGFREFIHYYVLLILPALLCITVFLSLLKKNYKLYLSIVISFLLITSLLFFDINNLTTSNKHYLLDKQYTKLGSVFDSAEDTGNWLKENTARNDKILVWANEPEIYFYANKVAPTKHIDFYGLLFKTDPDQLWIDSFNAGEIDWIVGYYNHEDFGPSLFDFLKDHPKFKLTKTIGNFIIFKKQ